MEALISYIVWKDHLYKMTVFILPPFALALILCLTWSGAGVLSQLCTAESQQQQQSASLCSAIVGVQEPASQGLLVVVCPHWLFSLISDTDPSCLHFLGHSGTGAKRRERQKLGQLSGAQLLVLRLFLWHWLIPVKISLTMSWHFLSKLSSPQNVWNYFHTQPPTPRCYKMQPWPTILRNLDLISFMVSLCFFFF